MKNWKAVTKSGTVYTCRNGIVRIHRPRDEEGSDYSIKVGVIKVVDRRDITAQTYSEAFWEHIHSLQRVALPEVGKSVFVGGLRDWRLSTPVVSVEVLDDDS